MASFDKEYFVGGTESNYKDYPSRKHNNLAKDIIKTLKIKPQDFVLDYGCGTGSLVNELRKKIYSVKGTDISKWAIDYGKRFFELKNNLIHYDKKLLNKEQHHILMLDVLEHCQDKELDSIFNQLKRNTLNPNILVRIPVAAIEHEDFVLDISKKDKTHIQTHSKCWWHSLFLKKGFDVIKIVREKTIYDSDGVLVWVIKKVI